MGCTELQHQSYQESCGSWAVEPDILFDKCKGLFRYRILSQL